MKKYFTWKNFSKFVTSVQFCIVLFGVIFTIFQIQEIKNNQLNRKNDLAINYYDRLNTLTNRRVGLAIDNKKPLLREAGGNFTEDQIDDYLGVFHDISSSLSYDLLDKNMTCSNFSDLAKSAWENREIQGYLSKIRNQNPKYFLGFDDFYYFSLSCK